MMGAFCVCGSSKKPSLKKIDQKTPVVSESYKTQLSDIPESTISIHSSDEILDDDFRARITEAIDIYITSIPIAYRSEHDRIVNEMSRSAPESYLGLFFSEYPNVNGPTVNEMARRLVTSNEAKQQLTDRVNEHIQSSFELRTEDWNSISRETARAAVKTLIEKLVNDAFDRIELA
ncbi:unnamed protein product [Rotaria sordida]|uniref:Uncharacterized protein n=1 Tax=Rotaria sordida TaxID=392033 RepID=A0A818SFE6_9BILA|nr:unnamed protein product [Rotaria sordida]CAF3666660.1 unnamed protein product [Rotaria sordida]